jgi:prefoldin subunit 5
MTTKIPEITKTIQMIQCLENSPSKNSFSLEMNVDFLISEGIFVRGKAKEDLDHVSLWLGANTIAELTFAEATDLLKTNLINAHSSLAQITEELAYIKDQKTTTEVNVARVYNISLALKREQQLARAN